MTNRTSPHDNESSGEGSRGGSLLSLLNGIHVLQAFSVAEPQLGVNEVARRVDLHKSTASRVLATLEQAGLVERDEHSGRFRLGLGVIGLAGPLLAHLDVRSVAYSALEELVHLTGETAALCVWSGQESVVVEQLPSPKQVKHTTPLGTRFAEMASASVQVFLAERPEPEIHRLLRQGLITTTRSTETTGESFVRHLATVTEQGHSLNEGETDPEELSVSAPVRDHRGSVVAAVLLSAPRARCTAFSIEDYIRRVRDTARHISARMGNRPYAE